MNKHIRAKTIYTKLIWVFIAIAAVGVGILLYESIFGQSDSVLFSLVVFVISLAALVMTTLQSIKIQRQLQLTEKLMKKTNQSSHDMQQLVEEDRKLERDIRKDMQLDQEVITVLEEYGIGQNAEVRREVASKIARKSKL